MKIFPLVDLASDWYPKHALEQFKKYSTIEFVSHPQAADIIWIFSYYLSPAPLLAWPRWLSTLFQLAPRKKSGLRQIPVVTTIHHLYPPKRQLWQPMITTLDAITDVWHFSSQVNLAACTAYLKKPSVLLPYWVDLELFYPVNSDRKKELKKQFNIPENKIIIGSFQRDTEADNRTPKLEKGPDIFFEIIQALDTSKVMVLLSGTRRAYLEKKLKQRNISFLNVGRVPFLQMNSLYNMLDYYLVTSRFEGGPQSILEAMATKTKIFSSPVGISDSLSPTVIFHSVDECVNKLNEPYPPVVEDHFQKSASLSAENVIPQFEKFFKKIAI